MRFGKTFELKEAIEQAEIVKDALGIKRFALFPTRVHDGTYVWLQFYYAYYNTTLYADGRYAHRSNHYVRKTYNTSINYDIEHMRIYVHLKSATREDYVLWSPDVHIVAVTFIQEQKLQELNILVNNKCTSLIRCGDAIPTRTERAFMFLMILGLLVMCSITITNLYVMWQKIVSDPIHGFSHFLPHTIVSILLEGLAVLLYKALQLYKLSKE